MENCGKVSRRKVDGRLQGEVREQTVVDSRSTVVACAHPYTSRMWLTKMKVFLIFLLIVSSSAVPHEALSSLKKQLKKIEIDVAKFEKMLDGLETGELEEDVRILFLLLFPN